MKPYRRAEGCRPWCSAATNLLGIAGSHGYRRGLRSRAGDPEMPWREDMNGHRSGATMMQATTLSVVSMLRRTPARTVAEHPEDAFDRWKRQRWDLEFP